MNKLKIFSATALLILLIFIVVAQSNVFRPDLSDPFEGLVFKDNIWNHTILCPQQGRLYPTPFYSGQTFGCTASSLGTSTFSYTNTTVGDGANIMFARSAASLGSSPNFAQNELWSKIDLKNLSLTNSSIVKWDIYLTADGSLTTNSGGGIASARIEMGVGDGFLGENSPNGPFLESLFDVQISGSGLSHSIPLETYHFEIIPSLEGGQVILRYENGTLINNVTLPDHPVDWQMINIFFRLRGDTTVDFASRNAEMTWNLYNYSVFETSIPFLEGPILFENQVLETQFQNINSSILIDNSSYQSVLATLNYGGKSIPTQVIMNGAEVTAIAQFDTPAVLADENVTFFFEYFLSGSGGSTSETTTVNQQEVLKTTFDICNGVNIPFLNITTKEEGTFTILNASLEFLGEYWLGTGTEKAVTNYQDLNNNKSQFDFCFSHSQSIKMDALISYYYDDPVTNETFPIRFYFLENATLQGPPFTTLLDLYLLTANSTTETTYLVIDQDFNSIPDAVVIAQRWFPGLDLFNTVAMCQTAFDGKCTMNIRHFDAYHRYIVLIDNVVVLQTLPLIETQTERELQIDLINPTPIAVLGNINYDLTFNNNTNVFTLTWTETTGLSQLACLRVNRVSDNTQLNLQCSTSNSGTLSYQLTQNGTFVGRAQFQVISGNTSQFITAKSIFVTIGVEERFTQIGLHGLIPGIILIGTLAFIGFAMGNMILVLFFIVGGAFVTWLIGFINFPPAVQFSIIAIALIIGFLAQRRTG